MLTLEQGSEISGKLKAYLGEWSDAEGVQYDDNK
jgi:hypothetical protein